MSPASDPAPLTMPGGPIIVLVEPQDLVNIASVVRIGKNFAVDGIRLVAPQVFDPYRIEGIAHNTGDLVERIELYDTLEEAVRDCVHVVGLTARERTSKRRSLDPREAATELVARRQDGPVALVAGREAIGLTNDELDRCRALAIIPTNAEYRSLNLAQAVAIVTYEVWQARTEGRRLRKPPRHPAGPASSDLLERLYTDWAKALAAVEFFKTRNPDLVMRSFREALFRADLDAREAALIRAMGIEVVRYLERRDRAVPSEAQDT